VHLKIWIIQGHSKCRPNYSIGGTRVYWRSIVTIWLYLSSIKMKRDIGRNRYFSYPPALGDPATASSSEYCHNVWYERRTRKSIM